jgi:DNA-binding CsgD family transcriptional regulator
LTALTYDTKAKFVRGWFAAYNARDIRELCALAHPSIEIVPMRPLLRPLLGTAFHGHDGLRTLMQWTFEHFPRIHAQGVATYETSSLVTAESTFVYDVEAAPERRRKIWSLFDIGEGGIRTIHGYATHEEVRSAGRRPTTLTPREREVFALLAQGLTATQIADELFISPLTVRTHIQNGKDRLGAKTRMEALSIALQSGEIRA